MELIMELSYKLKFKMITENVTRALNRFFSSHLVPSFSLARSFTLISLFFFQTKRVNLLCIRNSKFETDPKWEKEEERMLLNNV